MSLPSPDFILTLSCPDQIGIVHAVSGFLVAHRCNIVDSAQFGERGTGRFFMRVSFSTESQTDAEPLQSGFATVAERFGMQWAIRDARRRTRLLVMVSRFGHCLNDLLFRHSTDALPIEIPAIVSNHRDFEKLAASYDIPFHHVPVSAATRPDAERALLDLIARERIDLVALARYMQVLSDPLCTALAGRAINIHHSFLPSFKGARPYHQAHARGVKLIGATAHYVTPELDEGPIIEQDVARADHAMEPEELVAIGRDVESVVLARAVRLHAEHRVLVSGNRTVVFR